MRTFLIIWYMVKVWIKRFAGPSAFGALVGWGCGKFLIPGEDYFGFWPLFFWNMTLLHGLSFFTISYRLIMEKENGRSDSDQADS